MKYKYKPGDMVKPIYKTRDRRVDACLSMICYDPQMSQFENKVCEIESIYNEDNRERPEYRLKDAWNLSHTWQWVWDESWLEPIQTIDIDKDSLKALIDGGIEC